MFGGDYGGGGSGFDFDSKTYYFDTMDYAGANVLNSGSHTGTLDGAIADAKAALGGATAWFIVIRDSNGATVHSEGSDANAGQGKEPPTQGEGGEASGGGSTGGETGGEGEAGTLTYTFQLTGWVWVYDDKTNADPRLWTGHATEPVIGTTPGYGSADDAYNAGKAEGDANPAAMKLMVTASITGFTGRSYIWTERLQAAQNAVAAGQTFEPPVNPPDIVLPPGPPTPPPGPGVSDDMIALVATIGICVAIVYAGYIAIKGMM